MNLERYNYVGNSGHSDYEFYSEGPKGRIKKIVTFTKIQDAPVIYNLAFGDKDSTTGMLNDLAITNNNDRDKVLATVARAVVDFCDYHGDHYIYAEGSTPQEPGYIKWEFQLCLTKLQIPLMCLV